MKITIGNYLKKENIEDVGATKLVREFIENKKWKEVENLKLKEKDIILNKFSAVFINFIKKIFKEFKEYEMNKSEISENVKNLINLVIIK